MKERGGARLRELPSVKDGVEQEVLVEREDDTEVIVNRLLGKRFLKKALGVALIAVAGIVVAEVGRDR